MVKTTKKGRFDVKSVGMTQARSVLTDVIDDARDHDTATALTEYGRPRAVVVSVRFYERAQGDGELARLLWERHPELFDELKRELPETCVPRKLAAAS